MRILSVDVGAKRMGWAILEDGPTYIDSGIWGLEKPENQKYQDHRLDLIRYWVTYGSKLIKEYTPDLLASETLPLIGSGTAAAQSVLAATAITTLQAVAVYYEIPIVQIAAVTVKVRIGGNKTATKPKVRDGVFHFFPHLAERKSDFVRFPDETDAIGVGLVALGHRNSTTTGKS